MKQSQFELISDPINFLLVRLGQIWRLCYKNPGQERLTFERVGWITSEGVWIVGKTEPLTQAEFEELRRRTWPLPHEKGRNPANATLGVKSGQLTPKGGL